MFTGEARRLHWRRRPVGRWSIVIAALVVVAAACGDSSEGKEGIAVIERGSTTATTGPDEGDTTTTTEAEVTTTEADETTASSAGGAETTSVPTGRSPEEEERWLRFVVDGSPRMRPDGFGPFDFGTDVDEVLRDAEEAGMRVPRDTGWIRKSDVCAESGDGDYRQIVFERPKVQLSFTPSGGLVDWIVDETFSGTEDEFRGITVGSSVAEVEQAYGAELDTDGVVPVFELDPEAGGIFVVDGMIGLTSSVEDGGEVTAMWAGPDGCQRIFS